MDGSTEFLFLRKKDSGSDGSDPWEDEELIQVYDNALRIAKSEVAKRLAMDTNTKNAKGSKSSKSKLEKNKKNQQESDQEVKTNSLPPTNWNEGDHCRAVYSLEGVEYEAVISGIDGDTALVKYIGYENKELINLSELKASHGQLERVKQTQDANADNITTKAAAKYFSDNTSEGTQAVPPKKRTMKNLTTPQLPSFPPFALPNPGSSQMVPPPPPMPFLGITDLSQNPEDEKNLHSMLISWYMTGYYTGFYQGKKAGQISSIKIEPNK